MGEQASVKARAKRPAKSRFGEKLRVPLVLLFVVGTLTFFGTIVFSTSYPEIAERSAILLCNEGIVSASMGRNVVTMCIDSATDETRVITLSALVHMVFSYTAIIYAMLMTVLYLGKSQRKKVVNDDKYPSILLVVSAVFFAAVSGALIMGMGVFFPTLIHVATVFACDGQTVINSGPFSYGAGSASGFSEFYCIAENGVRNDVSVQTYLQAGIAYVGVAFVVTYLLNCAGMWFVKPDRKPKVVKKDFVSAGDSVSGESFSGDGVGNDWSSPPSADWGELDGSAVVSSVVFASKQWTAQEVEVALVELDELQARGLLTWQEHQAKREEIIARI